MKEIERIRCGNSNCFLIKQNNRAILVDTSRTKYRDKILESCRQVDVKLIVLTHGHVDHIQNAAYLSKELGAPIAMHKADCELIKNNMLEPMFADKVMGKLVLALSLESFKHDIVEAFEPTLFLNEGDSLENYGIEASVIELPGHTRGSIGLKVWEADLIVGDALMNLFYPTVSMLYGDKQIMLASATKITEQGEAIIHFGHGKSVANKQWAKN
ncbi:MBL fold metallo-hydrolase [Cellulosilyticum sp. ST5]|uniref:MBL fold metallo-hydrolase n=1 Tax=Cellulosilyticum sp. ST5 TaxID=3055805 RepID=UPI0039776580